MPIGNPGGGGGGGSGATSVILNSTTISGTSSYNSGTQTLTINWNVGFASYQAAEAIAPYQPVVLDSSGDLILASADFLNRANVIGICPTTASIGQTVSIQVNGNITNPLWNWDITKPIYLDVGYGILTQTAPTAFGKQICYIGMPISPTVISMENAGSRYQGFNQ